MQSHVVVVDCGEQKELGLLIESIPMPTVQIADLDGNEYVIQADQIRQANPHQAAAYWKERHRRSTDKLHRLIRRCIHACNLLALSAPLLT